MLNALELMQLENLAAVLDKQQQQQGDEDFRNYRIEMTDELYETNFEVQK